MKPQKNAIWAHILAGSFFIIMFIEMPLILASGGYHLWNYTTDPDLGVEWVIIWSGLICMLELMFSVHSAARSTEAMSTKV